MKTYSSVLSAALIAIGILAIGAGITIQSPALKSVLVAYLALP